MGCMKTSLSVQFLTGGCQEQTSVVQHPMLNRNHFSRNIFLLLETEGGKHQMFNSSTEKNIKLLFKHDFLASFPSGSEAL